MKYKLIGVSADNTIEAQAALKILSDKYSLIPLEDITDSKDVDVIVSLGGDGFMLHSLHKFINLGIPIYGMNCGTVGFLMNEYRPDELLERLENASITYIHPLAMKATTEDGTIHNALALNEVSLLRKTRQAAKIKIIIDGVERIPEMVCDGVLVSTSAGSSAYNFSTGGPILPLKSNLIALTPISPFRPRRWKGALLNHRTKVQFDILKSYKRPVNAVADFTEIENVVFVEIEENEDKQIQLLFDPKHSLEERILLEQFAL